MPREDQGDVERDPRGPGSPKGPDDPSICLIHVNVESAEYWDAPSSAWVYAYGYAKARLTGAAPHPGTNKVVGF